jgi:hypothetical protein
MIRLRVIAAAAPSMLYAATVAAETPVTMSALTYDFVGSTVTTDPNGKSRQQVIMRGHATSIGDKTRIDISEAGSATAAMRGSYLLLTDGGRRGLWVNSMTRQYRETDPESLFGGLGAFAEGANSLISMAASNIHVDAQKVGTGPVIQGHNTVHYQLHQRMDMKTKVFNKTVTTHDESITDYYYATDVANVTNPFLSSAPSLPQDGALVFSDDYAKQLRGAINKLYQGGAPLRTVVCDKTTDDLGHVQTTVTTTEMMNLKQVDVNPSLFEVPVGCTKSTSPQFSMQDHVWNDVGTPLSTSNLPALASPTMSTPVISASTMQRSTMSTPAIDRSSPSFSSSE